MRSGTFGVIGEAGEVLHKGTWRKCRNFILWIENKGGQPGALSIRRLDSKEVG